MKNVEAARAAAGASSVAVANAILLGAQKRLHAGGEFFPIFVCPFLRQPGENFFRRGRCALEVDVGENHCAPQDLVCGGPLLRRLN